MYKYILRRIIGKAFSMKFTVNNTRIFKFIIIGIRVANYV